MNTMDELQLCHGKMASQMEMLKTATEVMARLREELVMSGSAQHRLSRG